MASDIKATYLEADGVVFAGRTRVKAIHYKCGTNPVIELKDGDTSGAVKLKLGFASNTDDNVYLPDEGMLFANGCFADLTNVTNVTVFFN
tara:strand:- start:5738 stop:6007 length:270 start_codon:yes stop_codon:yes gene_type:complete